MKKLIAKLLIFLITSPVWANPIVPVTFFTEVYFEGDNWQIEIPCEILYSFGLESLDNIQMITSAGSSLFWPGLTCESNPNGVFIVDKYDLLTPLEINKEGDFLGFQYYSFNQWYDVTTFYFGNYSGSSINPLFEGQSYVIAYIGYGEFYNTWWLVKESNPSMGGFWGPISYGVFSGSVVDQNNYQVYNAQIKYCPDEYLTGWDPTLSGIWTDNTGHFQHTEMYGRNYNISVCIDDVPYYDTIITIEPEDTTHCEFILESYLVDNNDYLTASETKIENYPNPFKHSTCVTIHNTSSNQFIEPFIKIVSPDGQLFGAFPLNTIPNQSTYKLTIDIHDRLAGVKPGIYLYYLQDKGKILACNKMIITN